MAIDMLKRGLAPILPAAWELIDEEATRVLKQNLAARRLVDFKGPHGWSYAAVNTGRLKMLEAQPADGVHVGQREVLPLIELRAPIKLPLMELDAVGRGSDNPDLDAVVKVAETVARAENTAIFNGFAQAGITGILPASPHEPLKIDKVVDWPRTLLDAKERLRQAGIGGPYAAALGTAAYDDLLATIANGYPVARQVQQQIIDGPIVHVPEIEHAALISVRGGDYELVVGQDLSIGYAIHDKTMVELYLAESFTFRVLEPAAAIRLQRA